MISDAFLSPLKIGVYISFSFLFSPNNCPYVSCFFEIQSGGQQILLIFFYLKTPLFFPSLLRNIFLEYRALGLKLLSFSTLEILFHGLLASIDLNSDFFNLKIYVFQSFDYEEQRSDFLRIYPPWRLLG